MGAVFDQLAREAATGAVDARAESPARREHEARANAAALNPLIPLFELHERARRGDVERARDQGVTDILICPISPQTIITKLGAALERPRPFIAAPNFFGPDRRAKRTGFGGTERRVRKPRKVAIRVEFSSSDKASRLDERARSSLASSARFSARNATSCRLRSRIF